MKRFIAIALALVMLLALAACGSKDNAAATDAPAVTQGTEQAAATDAAVDGTAAPALDYPTKDMEIIIPYKVGGTTDLAVRGVLDAIPSSTIDKQITVTNLVGGSGLIGTEEFLTHDADGYTLGLLNCDLVLNYVNGTTTINPTEAMIPLAAVEQDPYLLLTKKNDNFSTFAEFVAYCEANPGKVVVGVTGVGTVPNMIGAVLTGAGLDISTVPYDSATDAIAGVLANEADICISAYAPAAGNIESGDLTPIAVTSAERCASLPDVPTMAEVDARFENVNLLSWIMIAVPAGTDSAIVSFLQSALADAVASEQYAETRATFCFEPITIGAEDLQSFIADQAAYYQTLQ